MYINEVFNVNYFPLRFLLQASEPYHQNWGNCMSLTSVIINFTVTAFYHVSLGFHLSSL
jgi:hypothetical protein